jgi:hypothetical protein
MASRAISYPLKKPANAEGCQRYKIYSHFCGNILNRIIICDDARSVFLCSEF